ncbi:tyrosine-protein phosphatase [Priestia megaterium]|uniref:tyrosine-protein phosphatase n=1 Tax=Priestia megaterium TaxID=1404 RepID=UPI00366BB8B5
MIDLYTNILPNLEDGPCDVDTFLTMAKSLVNQGVKSVVVAPTYNGQELEKQSIMMYVDTANKQLQHAFIPLIILPGQKIMIHDRLIQTFEKNVHLPINHSTKYMFLQLPNEHTNILNEQILYELQLKGIIPIINEPERNAIFLENPDQLYEIVKRGAVVQLSSDSIIGKNGRKEKKAALTFIDKGLAHIIASGVCVDTYESYTLPKAYDKVSRHFGTQALYKFIENADYIVEGKAIFKEQPERIKKGKFLGIF